SWLFYAEYNVKLVLFNLFRNSDYIYSVDADTLLAGGIINTIKKNKLIYDAHEYFEYSPEIINKKLIQNIWNRITRFGVSRAKYCITVCKSLSKIMGKQFGKEFIVIRNTPTKSTLAFIPIENRKKIIWYQGVLNIGRGLEEMIQCMPQLPEYELHLAGDGDIANELKQLVQNLKLESQVKFLGKLSYNDLIEKNRSSWIGINFLSDTSPSYYYSLANKTFDYIQAGLPSIHMNFPEYEEIINTYPVGIVIKTLTSSEIIHAVKNYESEIKYSEAIDACNAAAKEFCWENEATSLPWRDLLET
ncbi:MAG: glycosyltransferase, partial [Saprospiraceae bacterium]|nr:glycosyltransferase [Saprospiraceae bacterium]